MFRLTDTLFCDNQYLIELGGLVTVLASELSLDCTDFVLRGGEG